MRLFIKINLFKTFLKQKHFNDYLKFVPSTWTYKIIQYETYKTKVTIKAHSNKYPTLKIVYNTVCNLTTTLKHM